MFHMLIVTRTSVMSHETLIRMFRIGIVISEIKSEHRKRILTGESAVTPEHK